MSRTIGVIPARYASTRLPGKPLLEIGNKPMIQWVYEAALRARLLDRVIVATDDSRIQAKVEEFGGEAVMTSPDHATGSDRILEAIQCCPDAKYIINIQGDEPGIEPDLIDGVARMLVDHPDLHMTTAARPFQDDEDPSVADRVKVVVNAKGNALYFSRSLLPFPRVPGKIVPLLHLGIYGYERSFLESYGSLPESGLEQAESLEQLRALENGYDIGVHRIPFSLPGVDTMNDLENMRRIFQETGRL